MNWKRLVTSPPPATGWLIDGTVVAAVRRDPSGVLQCAAEVLPDGTCEVGPVGIQAVDRTRLVPVLNSIQGRVQGARRAAVVLPTGWVRAHLLEFDQLPRRQVELEQVVLWRLKKLLPVLPSELRVATVLQHPVNGRKRLMCLVGIERALAELEASFGAVGVEPGSITTRLFALAAGSTVGGSLLVQQEPGFLSLLLTVDDVPVLLRTKPLAAGGGAEESLRRELHLAHRFIRSELGVEGEISVSVSAIEQEIGDELERWWSQHGGVALSPGRARLPFVEPASAERLGRARLDPVLALIGGEEA